MELFQSSLLKYWEFQPVLEEKDNESASSKDKDSRRKNSNDSSRTKVDEPAPRVRWGFKNWGKRRNSQRRSDAEKAREESTRIEEKDKGKQKEKPAKRMPVCLNLSRLALRLVLIVVCILYRSFSSTKHINCEKSKSL